MSYIDQTAAKCGYAGYMDKYVTYPPKGPLPLPGNSESYTDACDIWWEIYLAAGRVNPVFNPYRIFDVVCYLLFLFSRKRANPICY
jgi:carboxypeptidase D